jgi:hypothetical protein
VLGQSLEIAYVMQNVKHSAIVCLMRKEGRGSDNMDSYRLISILMNPIAELILRSPFRFLLPKRWVVMTYTGRKTHKKRSVIFHMAQYRDEFIVVPGCFAFLPNWWRNFRKESMVDLFREGKSMKCLARAIEHDEANAAPRLAEYVRDSHAERIGITVETTEEEFNKLVIAAARIYPIVAIRPDLNEMRHAELEIPP